MSFAKQKLGRSSIVVGLFLLLGSFQNCALHQSDGRKQLDSLLARQTPVGPTNCLPYISQFDTDTIFEDTTTTELVSSTSVPSCKVAGGDERSGAGIAVCTLVQETNFLVAPDGIAASNGWTIYNSKVYHFKPSTNEFVDKVIGSGTLVPASEVEYYGVAVDNGDGFLNYHFVGSSPEMGIECRFSVDKADFDSDSTLRQELAKRGSKLMHNFYQICITDGNCSF